MPSQDLTYTVRDSLPYSRLCVRFFMLSTLVFVLPIHVNGQEQRPTGFAESLRILFGGNPTEASKEETKEALNSASNNLPLTTDPIVDEQLFMLRKLEYLYARWPTAMSDRERITGELASLRHEFVRNKEYAQAKGMETRLVAMFEDSIEMADRYSQLLADSGAIDREFYRKSVANTTNQGVDNFTEGLGIGGGLALAGVEPITATLLVGGLAIKKGVEGLQAQQRLDEQKAAAIEQRANKYLVERSRVLGRIEVQAGVLAEKHKWGAEEVGFDQNEVESQRVALAVERDDKKFLLQRAKDLKICRPRDPFVHAGSGELFANLAQHCGDGGWHELATVFRKHAIRDYIRAVQLIPASRFHDSLRAEYVWRAASNAEQARYHAPEQGDLPVRLVEAALKLQPRDTNGEKHLTLAYALARCGKYSESLAAFEKYALQRSEDDGSVCYNRACLLSLADKPDEALRYLQLAWKRGYRHVRHIKRDRDLNNLRLRKGESVAKLMEPKWQWAIDYGFVWNDVSVTNNSDFAFTYCAVKVTWNAPGAGAYSEIYYADSIPRGSAILFKGALDQAKKSPGITARAKICCSESRSARLITPRDAIGSYSGISTLMTVDGGDIKHTNRVRLEISGLDEVGVRMKLSGIDEYVDATANTIYDGVAIGVGANREKERLTVFFDNNFAYGWCQTPGESNNGCIWAFWVEK